MVLQSLRRVTRLPLVVHLMIQEPSRYLATFAEAGADALLVHQEAVADLPATVRGIKGLGLQAGVVINPPTPAGVLEGILAEVDVVLAMTVNPGFGGQELIPGTLDKVRQVRQMIDRIRPGCELAVDGGINPTTAPLAVRAGARVLVAGTAVFRTSEPIAVAVSRLRASVG
jgi:ribulose-phosphate 3-epimerase